MTETYRFECFTSDNDVFYDIVVELSVPDEWQFIVLAQKAKTFMVNNRASQISFLSSDYPEWKLDSDDILTGIFNVCLYWWKDSCNMGLTLYDIDLNLYNSVERYVLEEDKFLCTK